MRILCLLAGALAGPAFLAAPACSGEREDAAEGSLVLYSGRKEQLVQPILDLFTSRTGLRVRMRMGGASELANALLEEHRRPQADLYLANDAGTLEKLRMEGVLEPHLSPAVQAVPPELRAADGSWVGVAVRARVVMYNTRLVPPGEAPRSVLELTDPRWRGRLALTLSSNESLIAQVTALRLLRGEAAAEEWMRDLVANRAAFVGGHTQVRQAVGRGEFALGLVNHYYFHLELEAGSPVAVVYPDQEPGGMGAVVNVAGAGVVRGARNAQAARRLLDFLLEPEAQELFARLNFEIPVLPGVPSHGPLEPGSFRRAQVPLEAFGRELDATLDLMEKVGF